MDPTEEGDVIVADKIGGLNIGARLIIINGNFAVAAPYLSGHGAVGIEVKGEFIGCPLSNIGVSILLVACEVINLSGCARFGIGAPSVGGVIRVDPACEVITCSGGLGESCYLSGSAAACIV